MLLLPAILALIPFVAASAVPSELSELLSDDWPLNGKGPTDKQIVQQTMNTLESLYKKNNTVIDACTKCKSTLEIGKAISSTKPDLIPEIFVKWCKDNEILSNSTCETTFSRGAITASRSGTDFGNMLQLMDPWSIDGDYFCYFSLSQCPLPETPKVDLSSWWPPKNESNATIEYGTETFNVLHISDFHIELDYLPGSEANCTNNWMCCTDHTYNKNIKPESVNNSAFEFYESYYNEDGEFVKGHDITNENFNESVWFPATEFGHYKCDSPELLVNSSLKSIAQFQKDNNMTFDFAIFTGDMVDHDLLEWIDYDMVIKSQETVMRDLKKYLPDIPVFSVLGNHDTFPYGQIAPHSSGHENLYTWNDELFADLWVGYDWLPFENYEQIKKHYTGYSIVTKSGLKIIATNSNTYYQQNFYTYSNMTDEIDPFGTLKFIVDELVESEAKNQKVWIITHIPFVGEDMLPTQAEAYKQIVTRFSPTTITGIFFGHTHKDQFNVLYAHDNKTIDNAIMNTWIDLTVTPIENYNPGWRYYEVDTKSKNVMNSYNYYMKLNETFTNHDEPEWLFEYSAREAYDVNGTWPKTSPLNATFWAQAVESIKNEKSMAQTYSDFSYRLSPYVPDCSKGKCSYYYCYVSSFTINEYNECVANKENLINY
ncbi:hypothetical protein WICPIJ_007409 [Wickerhamomyces pijperi]|uniref:Calcineurin-like phosphoesterase domain-containing protein n=1 Tax=Wickerhamomyces pijperi TaxID=599730 RepID=A0A9P8TJZ4_WICPI|nr:hypothetical protein WICPIJ_007409 [Wickerhamomyces pijperi]